MRQGQHYILAHSAVVWHLPPHRALRRERFPSQNGALFLLPIIVPRYKNTGTNTGRDVRTRFQFDDVSLMVLSGALHTSLKADTFRFWVFCSHWNDALFYIFFSEKKWIEKIILHLTCTFCVNWTVVKIYRMYLYRGRTNAPNRRSVLQKNCICRTYRVCGVDQVHRVIAVPFSGDKIQQMPGHFKMTSTNSN